MNQKENPCDSFLKWALPKMQLRPEGYRKVRGQVCKRLRRRIKELGLHNFGDYRVWLEENPGEWKVLDEMTRITISRFFRDKKAWEELGDRLLPEIIRKSAGDELPTESFRKSAGDDSAEAELPTERVRKSARTELPPERVQKPAGEALPPDKIRESAGDRLLPEFSKRSDGERPLLRCWSAGCASGEEPYSLSILWREKILPLFPDASMEIIATDADPDMIGRAREGCYTRGSFREMPGNWMEKAFYRKGHFYCITQPYREPVSFYQQDIRKEMPEGKFDLVFCKNLAAMYFSRELATAIFNRISERMNKGAYLVLGNHEEIYIEGVRDIGLFDRGMNMYRKE
jgi:chemotaxis methyl-accepting protein methylase